MISFNPKRTIESSFTGNDGKPLALVIIPKATCGFRLVDSPEDKSCTFFAITVNVTIIPTATSTYICKLQSVTDILRDVTKKPLSFSILNSLMAEELSELSKMLDEDLKKHDSIMIDKIDLNEKPDIMTRNLKIEFDKYKP